MLRSLAPISLLLLAGIASASSGTANRGVRDIRLVHPPGTPPGTWSVQADIEFFADDAVPRPSDLGCELHVELNGVDIEVIPQLMELTSSVPVCQIGCVGGCSGWVEFPHTYVGQCHVAVFGSGLTLCGCIVKKVRDGAGWNSALRSSDVITVTIVPTTSTVADADASDDSMSITVGDMASGTPMCGGDGTTPTPCPCGNTGASGHGCANSANPDGALLGATGWTGVDASTGTDGVTLHGSGMPATSTAIYLKGDGLDPNGGVFGDGVLCVGGSLIRLRTKINVGGRSAFPEPGDPSLSVRGGTPPGSGLVGRYQVYYRNAASSFCPPATFNVSNGVELEW